MASFFPYYSAPLPLQEALLRARYASLRFARNKIYLGPICPWKVKKLVDCRNSTMDHTRLGIEHAKKNEHSTVHKFLNGICLRKTTRSEY